MTPAASRGPGMKRMTTGTAKRTLTIKSTAKSTYRTTITPIATTMSMPATKRMNMTRMGPNTRPGPSTRVAARIRMLDTAMTTEAARE
jgi:hypothetical protein